MKGTESITHAKEEGEEEQSDGDEMRERERTVNMSACTVMFVIMSDQGGEGLFRARLLSVHVGLGLSPSALIQPPKSSCQICCKLKFIPTLASFTSTGLG